jgi:hypothetical protein
METNENSDSEAGHFGRDCRPKRFRDFEIGVSGDPALAPVAVFHLKIVLR